MPVPLGQRATEALDAEGSIARGVQATGFPYEVRDGQLEMTRAVADAIEDEHVLMCEAGTGTGKTLAYLVPAILSGRRVVVSTATKALQEQIYTKDLPLLARHLGAPVSAALMKGLANYVCLRRLDEALKIGDLERTRVLTRIEEWVRQTETGDRVELTWLRDDEPSWRDAQSGSDTRVGVGCAFYDRCFVTKMRNDAMKARLVVVNHHLYLADLALRRGGARQGVIPDHDVVIFDEAHQLEEIATEFFGTRVSSARVDAIVRDARRTLSAAGLLPKKGVETPEAKRLASAFDRITTASQRFFATMASSRGLSTENGRAPLSEDAWTEDAVEQSQALDRAMEALAAGAKGRDSGEEVAALVRRIQSFRNDLTHVAAPTREDVPWIDVRSRSCAIGVSPIDLAPVFRSELFSRDAHGPRTIVMTSATLATGQGFLHAKRRLGLLVREAADEETGEPGRERDTTAMVELVVPSPFDFPKKAGVYVPIDLPEPNDPSFVAKAGARVVELVLVAGGGAFVLCASTRNMRAMHAVLTEASLPFPILCQGERPKTSLLEAFRAEGNAVLVATMGFWEGVDVPGHALRLVIIDKLPFAVPSDPVVAARFRAIEAEGRSAFAELSVPDAAIALKQGFGRLIRTRDDSGVVAILDKRLRTKGYGRPLRASLPPAAPLRDVADVQSFFDVVVRPSLFP